MATFYENQIKGANDIVSRFQAGENYTILLAEMQSGKSDAFMLSGAELVRLGLIDQFVVFSGNAETALQDQAKNQKDFWRKYRRYLRQKIDDDDETADRVEDTWNDKSVIWASSLLKWTRQSGRILFIWDESHFAQSGPSEKCPKGNRPYQFLAKHGLSAIGGEHRSKGDLMLSVSATPFSEVIANGETSSKPVVYMEPGVGYRGLEQMMVDDQVVPYDVSKLKDVFERLALEVKDEGVGIVRATGAKALDLERWCEALKVLVKVHDITDSNDINWYLGGGQQNHPLTGVIIVKGKVKMGTQLKDKSRIRWCMETSTCSNTDTFLQGLAGRCMGYLPSGTHKGIKIYVSATYYWQGDHQKYIKMMEHFRTGGLFKLELPSRAKNVLAHSGPECPKCKKTVLKCKTSVYRCKERCPKCKKTLQSKCTKGECKERDAILNYAPTIPEMIKVPLKEWEGTNDDVKDLVRDNLDDRAKKDFILTSPNNVSVKEWEVKHGEDYVAAMQTAIKNKSVFKCPFPQLKAAKVWVEGCPANGQVDKESKKIGGPKVFAKYAKSLLRKGETHMVVYVQYQGEIVAAKEVSNETTGIEVFSNQPKVSETIEDNGTSSMSLGANTSSSVQEMTSALDYFVQQTTSTKSPSSVKMRCSINSNADDGWKGIAVTSEVFASIKRNGIIYKQILSKYNVKLSARKNGNSNPKGFPAEYIRLSSISW